MPARHREHVGREQILRVAQVEDEQRVRRRRLGECREAAAAQRRARGVETAQRAPRRGQGARSLLAQAEG